MAKKIGKYQLILLIAFFISAAVLKIWQYHWPEAVVELKKEQLTVLVAKTPWHWHRGLGKRDTLEPYDGMIFLFPFAERHAFVMRDTRFPLDIVWLERGTVVDIAQHVQPEDLPEEELTKYIPRAVANMVLELPAGWSETHQLEIGNALTVLSE